jgi:hypothetical protein
MASTDLKSLVEFLRRRTSRTHVGLWLMPLNRIGFEAETAIRLGVQELDISKYLLEKLPPGADFVRLSAKKIIKTLNEVASSIGQSDCVLVFNFDLLLSGVSDEERQQVWQELFNRFPGRARILLIAIPDKATHLFPYESLLKKWQDDSRLA